MTAALALVVAPVGSDEQFLSKRKIIETSAGRLGWAINFPPYVTIGAMVSGMPLRHVMASMTAADLVIADLSLERPSCYYELGVAQALGRPNFLLAATGTEIHQAAGRDGVHFYASLEEFAS